MVRFEDAPEPWRWAEDGLVLSQSLDWDQVQKALREAKGARTDLVGSERGIQ